MNVRESQHGWERGREDAERTIMCSHYPQICGMRIKNSLNSSLIDFHGGVRKKKKRAADREETLGGALSVRIETQVSTGEGKMAGSSPGCSISLLIHTRMGKERSIRGIKLSSSHWCAQETQEHGNQPGSPKWSLRRPAGWRWLQTKSGGNKHCASLSGMCSFVLPWGCFGGFWSTWPCWTNVLSSRH